TRSPTTISPAVGSTKPAIRRNVVVLPQPEGPSRQTSNPCSMRSDTSSTAAVLSYRLVRFRSSTDATLLSLPPPPLAGEGWGWVPFRGTDLRQDPPPYPSPASGGGNPSLRKRKGEMRHLPVNTGVRFSMNARRPSV